MSDTEEINFNNSTFGKSIQHKHRNVTYSLREFMSKNFPKGKPILNGLFAQQELHVLVATAKTGKSFFALNLAISVCEGLKFLDKFESDPGKVLVWQTEVSEFRLQERFKKVLGEVSSDKALDNLHVVFERIKLNNFSGQESLETRLYEIRPKVLILDPLYTLHDGDENSSKDMAEILTYLRDLSHRFEVGILLVHHQGKSFEGSAKNTQAGHRGRGSSTIADVPDGTWHLSKTKNGARLVFELRNEEDPGAMDLFSKNGWWHSLQNNVLERGTVKDVSAILESLGPLPAKEFKSLFQKEFGVSERTVEKRISFAVKSKAIVVFKKGNVTYYAVESHVPPQSLKGDLRDAPGSLPINLVDGN